MLIDVKSMLIDVKSMLIDVKSMLSVGNTLVPLIFMSDGTHLSNFAANMKERPVYMTIRNVSPMICLIPSSRNVVMVALLPIPIMNRNILSETAG